MHLLKLLFLTLSTLVSLHAKISVVPQTPYPQPDTSQMEFLLSAAAVDAKEVGNFTHEKVLRCTPAISGSFEYSARNKIIFYPDRTLQAGTSYNCRLSPSHFPKARAQVSFTTQALQVETERYGSMVRLSFNTAVDPKKLAQNLLITRTNRLRETKLSFDISSDSKKRHFVAAIKEAVSKDNLKLRIQSSLDPSLKSEIIKELSSDNGNKIVMDAKRKSMYIGAQPRFLAKDDGSIGIRLYLPNSFYSSTPVKPFLRIDGVENFQVSAPSYLYYDERNRYKVPNNHYYYVDITGDFVSGKPYTLTVLAGLKDSYSYQLRRDQQFEVTMGDRKQSVAFESDKPYLSSNGEIGLRSVNTDKINIVVEHLLDQNYRYFINFKEGDPQYVASMVKEIKRQSFVIGGKRNRFTDHKISLRSFMKERSCGVYRVTVHFDKKRSVSKTFFYSDIGITAKVADDQLFIWTTSLSDAKPMDDVEVEVYSERNELLATAQSNDDGVALISQKLIADKHPKAIVVTRDKEQNFLYLDKSLNKVDLPLKRDLKNRYKALIYLQSRLVRPGNDAQILMLLKDKNYLSGPGIPVKVTVKDPSRYTVFEQVLTTDSHGAMTLKLPVPQNYKTGTYTINLKIGTYLVGSRSFSVEDFMPQRIKNSISIVKKAFRSGERLHAKLSSRYLFGAPASHLKAQVKLSAVSKVFTHDAYKGYRFNNTLAVENGTQNYLSRTKSLLLNSEGKAEVLFDTVLTQRPPSILSAQLALTVFDDGRGVSAYEERLLYPYEAMVGLKTRKNSLEKGEKLIVDTVAIDPQKGTALPRRLDVVLKKRSWEYYYDSRGYYRWHKRYSDIERFTVLSGQRIQKSLQSSGDYTLLVSDPLSGHASTAEFSVRGWDYTPIDPTSDMGSVQVKIPAKSYKKGDTLHVDIKSPLAKAALLVTLESDRVLWHKVLFIQKASASLDVDLDFDFPDGFYLRTHAVRATDTQAKMIPFRASSATYIKPDRSAYKQDVSIDAVKQSRSHTKVPIRVTARPNSSVVVSVVDEGILQIKGQEPPKAFEFFQSIPKEQISLFDIYDKVMHHLTHGKRLSFGSDATAKMKRERKHLSPQTGAKRVKPFVYWSGILKTDSSGEVKTTLPIPAFNGEATIVAVAYDAKSIGVASQSLVIKDAIIIKPTFPRFIHIGDRITVPVRIFNTTASPQKLKLTASQSSQLKLGFDKQELLIEPNRSLLTHATLEALAFGKGELSITAANEKQSFRYEVELPVTSPFSLQTKVYRGETTKPVTITPDKELFGQTPPKLYAALSDSYLTQLQGSVNALIGYPYGCAEQTSSKILAMLYIEKFIKGGDDRHTQGLLSDRKHFIQEGIYKLAAMQKYNGEFGYWRASDYTNPYASIYASDIILELKRQGFNVPDSVVAGVYKALRNQSRGSGTYRYGSLSHFERLYAAYLLSREGQLDRPTANALYDQQLYRVNFLSRYMMAAILKDAGLKQAMQSVLSEIEAYDFESLPREYHLGGSFYTRGRDLAFALYIHTSHFQKNRFSRQLLEAVAKELKNSYSTQERALIMRAMVAHYKDQAPQAMKMTLTLGTTQKHFDKPGTLEARLDAKKITIRPEQGIVNYSIEVSNYMARAIRHLPLKEQKSVLKLNREYVDENNRIINPSDLKIGDLFYSRITLASDKELRNLVISDRIPACFEIVNERLNKQQRSAATKNSSHFKADYQDIRDNQVLTFVSLGKPRRVYSSINRSYEYLPNTQQFFQPMRIASKGRCVMPAVIAEAMYDGRISAYDKAYETLELGKGSGISSPMNKVSNILKQIW